jgi:SAM-dependent methyltransferase
MRNVPGDVWASGAAYEPYIGRWSRPVARDFLEWLDVPPNSVWVDVGCGTGALTETILAITTPARVEASDRSPMFIEYARANVRDPRAGFVVADTTALPHPDDSADVVVSGLMLNFVPEPEVALAEMQRITRPNGAVAAYVWDYAGEMQLMRRFWDAATSLDERAHELDEGVRFPICKPDALEALFRRVGLRDVQTRAIDVATPFRDFEDYWTPFLGGQAPAPSYALGLSVERRLLLREHLRSTLPIAPDGSIDLMARAWAVRGRRA